MAFIKITKPVSSNWTPTNPAGRTQYDQANITYDDPTMYYDGLNPSQWGNTTKPVSSNWTKITKPT